MFTLAVRVAHAQETKTGIVKMADLIWGAAILDMGLIFLSRAQLPLDNVSTVSKDSMGVQDYEITCFHPEHLHVIMERRHLCQHLCDANCSLFRLNLMISISFLWTYMM